MRLLGNKYKTYDGAQKRCGFENGVAKGEYERGEKSKLYRYTIERDGDSWRVGRHVVKHDRST